MNAVLTLALQDFVNDHGRFRRYSRQVSSITGPGLRQRVLWDFLLSVGFLVSREKSDLCLKLQFDHLRMSFVTLT